MADIQVDQPAHPQDQGLTCMKSINRVSKMPVVESTLQTATNVYGKVKDYNTVTQWTCSTGEQAVHKAVEVATPLVMGLEGPIKKIDGVLCTGLDYVESKVPAVNLPPGEMVTCTKEYVNKNVTPVVSNVYEKIEPAVQSAKTVIDPYVQPALDTAKGIVDYGVHKIEEVMHPKKPEDAHKHEHEHPEGVQECDECKQNAKQNESRRTAHSD